MIFNLLQILAKPRELRALRFVPQRHIGFERGFVSKQLVFICFVWTNSHVYRGIKVHPGNIAVVIIIGRKSSSSFAEKIFQGLVSGKAGSFAQQLPGRFEKLSILFAIRNDH